jgi:transcription antitermination factor NusG
MTAVCAQHDMLITHDQARWIALYVARNAEANVSQALVEKGYEEFYPTYTRVKCRVDSSKCIQSPLFPRYVFCRITTKPQGLIVTTPGVIKIIGHNGQPYFIEDDEIFSLKSVVRSQLPVSPHPFLCVGDRVTVGSGPLAGLSGLLLRANGNLNLVVSVQMMERSIVVTLPRSAVVYSAPCGDRVSGLHPVEAR